MQIFLNKGVKKHIMLQKRNCGYGWQKGCWASLVVSKLLWLHCGKNIIAQARVLVFTV
jgi:hypothetical protein